jgi:hypothetical protein
MEAARTLASSALKARSDMLANFPKIRQPLPKEFRAIYAKQYKDNRSGNTPASFFSQAVESWLHKTVAADVRYDVSSKSTLELGAGTLNQLGYEPIVGPYDIVEPFRELYEASPLLRRVRDVYSDIKEVPQDHRYDRITSVATFEHICNLPEVVAKAGLLLNPAGTLRVSIPSEGTFLWRLGWKLTTGLEFRVRYGLDYGVLMRHEHVNTAREIRCVLKCFFSHVRPAVFGLCASVSLYQYFECARPYTQKCRDYLDSIIGRVSA